MSNDTKNDLIDNEPATTREAAEPGMPRNPIGVEGASDDMLARSDDDLGTGKLLSTGAAMGDGTPSTPEPKRQTGFDADDAEALRAEQTGQRISGETMLHGDASLPSDNVNSLHEAMADLSSPSGSASMSGLSDDNIPGSDDDIGASSTGMAGMSDIAGAQTSQQADGTSNLREELGQLKSELDTLLTHASALTERELADAHARLMMKFGSLRAVARTMASNAGDKLNQGKEVTYERVRNHPMQSVAIAAGAGVLMGMVMRRH